MNRIAILLVPILTLFSVLHGGRTDAWGGHYDHSAGEYHYHHGMPAHDHYDIDGDGVIDCPYSFRGNSGESEKTNNTSESASGRFWKITFVAIGVVVVVYILRKRFG